MDPNIHHTYKTFVQEWGSGQATLFVATVSYIEAQYPELAGRGRVTVKCFDLCEVLHAPPSVSTRLWSLEPERSQTWLEDLSSLVALESGETGTAISALLDGANPARLPATACSYFKSTILSEIRSAAQTAARMERRTMWTILTVQIRTKFTYREYLAVRESEGERSAVDENDEEESDDEEEEEEEEEEAAGPGASMKEYVTMDLFAGDGPAEMCTVCLCPIGRGSMAGWMPCSHLFHPECICRWLKERTSCPVCRLELPKD